MVIVARFTLLALLFLYSPAAYACYLLAYVLFLTVLRFMDALQHNYEIVWPSTGSGETEAVKHGANRAYEQAHTFSNPVSIARPWMNLLTLNFGYHNAHHARPAAPWHELPGLHQALYGGLPVDGQKNRPVFVIPFRRQLSSFHNGRVARVLGDHSETQGSQFAKRLEQGRAVGADGMSFLTP